MSILQQTVSYNTIVAGEKLDYKYEFFTYYNNKLKL